MLKLSEDYKGTSHSGVYIGPSRDQISSSWPRPPARVGNSGPVRCDPPADQRSAAGRTLSSWRDIHPHGIVMAPNWLALRRLKFITLQEITILHSLNYDSLTAASPRHGFGKGRPATAAATGTCHFFNQFLGVNGLPETQKDLQFWNPIEESLCALRLNPLVQVLRDNPLNPKPQT